MHRLARVPTALLACVLAIAGTRTADATEIVLQNDSLPTPASGTVLNTFLAGEKAAVWFTAPQAGSLVGVQIFWNSLFGPNPGQLELSIEIWAGGPFPSPGALLATVVGPTLNDGVVNEFRFLDPPTDAVPLSIPLSSGQTFAVSIEFLNQSSGNAFASSVVYDGDGCQAGKNAAFAIPGGWIDACAAGVAGDLGIRAIQQIPEPRVLLLLIGLLAALRRDSRLERTPDAH